MAGASLIAAKSGFELAGKEVFPLVQQRKGVRWEASCPRMRFAGFIVLLNGRSI